MPDQHTAADEHALMRQVTDSMPAVADDPVGEVSRPQFPVVLRGYDRAAVDDYVRLVTQLVRDLVAQRSPREAIHRAIEDAGRETSAILERAHELADQITSRSRAEAEERVQSARRQADEIVASSRERLVALDRDADLVWAERARILEDVRRVAGELERVVEAAGQRFPPEDEPKASEEPAETAAPNGATDEPEARGDAPAANGGERATELASDATQELPTALRPESDPD